MAKETRKVHISVTSNASKDLNKGTVAAKGLSGSLKGVGAAAQTATGGIKAMAMALVSSGIGVVVLGLGSLVAGLGSVISKSTEFEKALSTLEAVSGSSSNEMTQLSDLAKELGSTTAFTASQVVELQTELAKLGFKTSDISNATGAILDLAASLEVGLGEAAEFSGSLVKSFGLTTEETARVVDVMAKSTSSSALNFEGLRESLKLVAPVAKATDVSIERTTALLGVLADRGLKGSIAGTGLGQTFVELNKKGLTLEQAMDKVSSSSNKLGTAMKLVGTRGGRALLTLTEGRGDIEKLTQSFEGAEGAAKKMADIKLDNLAGDTTKLASAWEGFLLTLEDGSGVLNKIARGSLKTLTTVIGSIQSGLFKLSIGWESFTLALDAGELTIKKVGAQFKALGKEISIFGVDALIAMSDVPIIGGLVDDATLIAKRKQLTGELEEANKAINDFAIQQFENEKLRDQKKVEYRLGRRLKDFREDKKVEKKLEEEAQEVKDIEDQDKRDKELEAKKAFLAKLKKLDEDTDDTTQLEKIQRKRERHLEELKQVVKDKTQLKEAEKTINDIYDQMAEAEQKKLDKAKAKKLEDFVKQFGVESIDPDQALKDRKDAHLAELELLKLEETDKKEAVRAIDEYYKSEQAKLDEQNRLEKAEQDRLEYETKRGLILDGLDLAIQASGEESKIGQALMKVKQGLMLAEMVMKMNAYIQNMKMQAGEALTSTQIKAAEQSASINVGFANAAKLGPPFNAIPLALMSIQAGMMIKNMAKSKKEMKQATAGLGGTSRGGGGGTAPQAPNFNVIGQTTAGENLIADTIQGANSRPMRAFVVDKDITSSQELARNTENEASIG